MHNSFLKKYFFVNSFEPNLIKCQDKNTLIIYRNYENENINQDIINLKNFCKKNRFKLFLSNNFKLALKLQLNGAYIPSFNNKFDHLSYSLRKNFIIIGSAHNHKEIKIKQRQKVSIIFLSSLFKKNKNYLGINKFKILTNKYKKKIVALGGIEEKNLKKIKLLNIYGIAGKRFFKKKGPF
tara:strand:- start:68 stop:610 length:543 start_codon:yes stop_codon:yes gene_type:complete